MSKDIRNAFGLLFLRLMAGAGLMHHGYAHLFAGRMTGFTEAVARLGLPFPTALAWAAALSEFLGGLLILLGLKTRVAAAFVFLTMSLAAFISHGQELFGMRELTLAYGTVAGAIVIMGGGRYGLDRA